MTDKTISVPTESRLTPIDGKFGFKDGKIVNLVSGQEIPEDEPLFLLRARDHHAIETLEAYSNICLEDCNELHLQGTEQVIARFRKFAEEHPERMKQPGITRHLKLDAASSSLLPVPSPLVDALQHGMNCPGLTPTRKDECTCGFEWRIRLRTEQEMHRAWKKRAEEAELELQTYQALPVGRQLEQEWHKAIEYSKGKPCNLTPETLYDTITLLYDIGQNWKVKYERLASLPVGESTHKLVDRGESAEQEQNKAGMSSVKGDVLTVPPLSNERSTLNLGLGESREPLPEEKA